MTISNCFKMSFMALKGEGEGIFAHYFIGMNLVQLRKAVRSNIIERASSTFTRFKSLVLKGCIVTGDALHCHLAMAAEVRNVMLILRPCKGNLVREHRRAATTPPPFAPRRSGLALVAHGLWRTVAIWAIFRASLESDLS
jgi:hypothetical protein